VDVRCIDGLSDGFLLRGAGVAGTRKLFIRRNAMQVWGKLVAFVGALVLLGALAGSSFARNFSATETRMTATFSRVEFSGGFGTTRCNVTVSGILHSRTVPKVLESLVGLVTEASVGGCETGSATILTATLPWHVRYSGFTGTLPNITSIIVKSPGVAFQIREPVFGVTCLASSTASSPATGTWNREAGGRITSQRAGGTLPTNCGMSGTLSGTSVSLTPAVTVTLI